MREIRTLSTFSYFSVEDPDWTLVEVEETLRGTPLNVEKVAFELDALTLHSQIFQKKFTFKFI